jgi:molybdate transport system substrate-binding protein
MPVFPKKPLKRPARPDTPAAAPQARPSARLAARLAGLAAALLVLGASPARADQPVTIFAAASTMEAVNAVARAYEAGGRGAVRPVFAASSTLALQIARGAPADLFLSANTAWMDDLERRGVLEPRTRIDLLGNALVLIAPRESPLDLEIAPGFALAEALSERRLAMGDPAHVPAGIYAKAALERLGVWSQVAGRVAFLGDVRTALILVDRGEAAAGIVYASDARVAPRVRVVGAFPADSHPPIVYPLAVVAGRRGPAVMALYAYLRGPEARALFRARGFVILPTGPPAGPPAGPPDGG